MESAPRAMYLRFDHSPHAMPLSLLFEVDGICVRKHHVRGTWEGPVVSQTGRAAAEKDHLEPPRLLRRLPAPSVPMSRLAEELPGVMFQKAGMTE